MSDKKFKQRAAYLSRLLLEINKHIHDRIKPVAGFMESSLTVPQVHVLHYLMSRPVASMTDLAKWAGVALPTMTDTVQRLVRLKRVERVSDPTDRRVVKVRITRRGKHGCQHYAAMAQQGMERLLQNLKDHDQIRLENAFRILESIFIREQEQPHP